MTDREAMIALAKPEPELTGRWIGGGEYRTSRKSIRRFDKWNRRRIKALRHVAART